MRLPTQSVLPTGSLWDFGKGSRLCQKSFFFGRRNLQVAFSIQFRNLKIAVTDQSRVLTQSRSLRDGTLCGIIYHILYFKSTFPSLSAVFLANIPHFTLHIPPACRRHGVSPLTLAFHISHTTFHSLHFMLHFFSTKMSDTSQVSDLPAQRVESSTS